MKSAMAAYAGIRKRLREKHNVTAHVARVWSSNDIIDKHVDRWVEQWVDGWMDQ